MLTLAANIIGTPERRNWRGREHLVVPTVMVQEQALNGEFLPREEIERTVENGLWEGKPVTLGHPTRNGQHVSANGHDVLEEFGIGRLFNVEMKGDKAVGEMWIDVERLKSVPQGKAILNRLSGQGPMVEVSTAYLRDVEMGEGGRPIQRNLSPDHHAVLWNEEGACSVHDGCGAPRANERLVTCSCGTEIENAADPDDEGTAGDEGDEVDDEQTENVARRVLNWIADQIPSLKGASAMDRDQMIEGLAANEDIPFDEEELQGFSDQKLKFLAAHNETDGGEDPDGGPEPASADGGEDPEGDDPEGPEANVKDPQIPDGWQEFFANADPDDFAQIIAQAEKEKKALVESLVANERCRLTREKLEGFDADTLRDLHASFGGGDYTLNAGVSDAPDGDVDVPTTPSLVTASASDGRLGADAD